MATGALSPLARRGIVIAAVLALSVGACGRRGSLETPGAVDPAVSAAPGDPATGTAPAAAPRPRNDFLLDAII
uniref:lipoprotein n=1 Tax=Stappia sp. TaxID=1870903 RepID=UPI003BA9BFEB